MKMKMGMKRTTTTVKKDSGMNSRSAMPKTGKIPAGMGMDKGMMGKKGKK